MAGELPAIPLLDILPSQAQGSELRSAEFCDSLFGAGPLTDPGVLTSINVLNLACNAASGSTGLAILTARWFATVGPSAVAQFRDAALAQPQRIDETAFDDTDDLVFGHWAAFAWSVQNLGGQAFADAKEFFAAKWREHFNGEVTDLEPPPSLNNIRTIVGEATEVLGAPTFATRRGFDALFGPPSIVGFGLFPPEENGLA